MSTDRPPSSMSPKTTVLVTEPIAPGPLGWLDERAEVVLAMPGSSAFDEAAPIAEALVVRTYTRVDAELLSSLPSVRVVGRAGVGLDNIDLELCAQAGIEVVSTPDANTSAVVEFVVASMLDAVRPRGYLDRALDPEAWNTMRADLIAARQLAGSTLGVLGLGRIGSRVARAAEALGMRVIFHDLREIESGDRCGAEPVSIESLLSESDILTVHVDGRPENTGLVGADAFARMKDEIVFINTSRGMVVDSESCAMFMRAKPGAIAILDVHDPEPIPVEYPLLMMPNVYLTPHIASATSAAKERMSWVVRDVWDALNRAPSSV